MLKIYIHKFVDLPLIDYYIIRSTDNLRVIYVDNPIVKDTGYYIVVLKDRLVVNSPNSSSFEDDKDMLDQYIVNYRSDKLSEYVQERQSCMKKKNNIKNDVLIPVFINKSVLNGIPDCIMLYNFYGQFSDNIYDTKVFYVDELSENYSSECELIKNASNLCKHYLIVYDTCYSKFKIVDTDNKNNILTCDYRILGDLVNYIRNGTIDNSLIENMYIWEYQVYMESDFNVDILFYCHTRLVYNELFNINIVDNTLDILSIYKQFSRNDETFIIATNSDYKFIQKKL
jgi:hypothetical protein